MHKVERVWFDPSEDGQGVRMRLSFKVSAVAPIDASSERYCRMIGAEGPVGYLVLRFFGLIGGYAVFEVSRLLPADADIEADDVIFPHSPEWWRGNA
ncbi:hypothetical protein RPE78_09565 [Thioclava litoralis]|uniref:Uncharacterized protein n=1 Tax=Thioclava litoralis TaxID=3076557 RepID=A0ABZ1DW04_9RHOB|nr:hypothetical protein RPE78_09565 [Thioclava sp. FTW29]